MFNLKKVTCPRCLGKGHVDEADIERLRMQLNWAPGTCAYCEGSGKVSQRKIKRVAADEAYLTTDISKMERDRLSQGDEGAKYRAASYSADIEFYHKQILFLHGEAKMDAALIAKFYQIEASSDMPDEAQMLHYIQRVIDQHSR